MPQTQSVFFFTSLGTTQRWQTPASLWPSAGSRLGPAHSTSLPICLLAAEELLLLLQAKESDLDSFKETDVKVLSSHQLIEFLSLLLQEVNHPTS